MAKLTVRNVGPIREAELEVRKHTIFIGPQGTGKSTLAKLIAIGSDYEILPFTPTESQGVIIEKYALQSYLQIDSAFSLSNREYTVEYNNKVTI